MYFIETAHFLKKQLLSKRSLMYYKF